MPRPSLLPYLALLTLVAACDDATAGPDALHEPDTTDALGEVSADTTSDVAADTAGPSDATTPSDTRDTSVADSAPADSADAPPDAGGPLVVFAVTVPANTPAGSAIHISGDLPELGAWDGIGLQLTALGDGRYGGSLSLPLGTHFEYKVTRGSWETVEKDANGGELPNRTHTVTQQSETLAITVATWRDLPPVPPEPGGLDFIRGVSSAFLDHDRDIVVYLPPGYDADPDARYPVLYMHDGQNLMDPATSAFGVAWEVDDTAESLITQGRIAPLIIVGVYNSPARIDEYTPVVDPEYGGGRADDYGRFLAEELKPDIDATYRTRPEASVTGLAGSSLGGLVSMYLGLERSQTFTRLGVVSPSVWWADRDIVERVNELPGKLPLKIWLDIGTAEGGGESVEDTRLLRDALVTKGWVLGDDLVYREYEGASHDEAAWAARVDDILEALYPIGP